MTSARYSWLRRIQRLWIVDLGTYNGVFGYIWLITTLISVVVSFVAAFFVDPPFLLVAALVASGWAIYITVELLFFRLLYTQIKCPRCGLNPTRRKADQKPMSFKSLFPTLEKLAACPSCGDGAES